MYFYALSCLNPAFREIIILEHSKKLSEKRFKELRYKAVVKSADEISNDKYVGEIYLETLIQKAADILVRDWAFRRAEVMIASYPSTGRLETKRDFDCLEFRLPEDLEEKIILHNQRVQDWAEQEAERLIKYKKEVSQR